MGDRAAREAPDFLGLWQPACGTPCVDPRRLDPGCSSLPGLFAQSGWVRKKIKESSPASATSTFRFQARVHCLERAVIPESRTPSLQQMETRAV